MPCTAKKFEAMRKEMINNGIADVDAVLTTRELARLIRLNGINIKNIEAELTDSPIGTRSSAGKLVGTSGGITEAILRTLYSKLNGEEMRNFKIAELRGVKGIKKAKINLGKIEIGVAVINGLGNANKFLNELSKIKNDIKYIEIMACPGGCIGGGGQPFGADDKILRARMNTIYEIDENETIKVAHKNPYIIDIYENFLVKPLGEKSCKLLHTNYTKRDVLL
jgi:iron only hydrogenase large subunit-like protein